MKTKKAQLIKFEIVRKHLLSLTKYTMMNIFVLDHDTKKSAQYHCDKHVLKMCIEYTQLLSSVHHFLKKPAGYKLTHKNHPCAVWARSSMENYKWLLDLVTDLGEEYSYRYGGKVHKSVQIAKSLPVPELESSGLTEQPKCMPAHLTQISDVVEAYRMYYCTDKARFCTWKKRENPGWFINLVQ